MGPIIMQRLYRVAIWLAAETGESQTIPLLFRGGTQFSGGVRANPTPQTDGDPHCATTIRFSKPK